VVVSKCNFIKKVPLPFFLTHPPSPSLKAKGRSENPVYHEITPFPLNVRGRDGVRVQKSVKNMSFLRQSLRGNKTWK
jgi:hypothetical protein